MADIRKIFAAAAASAVMLCSLGGCFSNDDEGAGGEGSGSDSSTTTSSSASSSDTTDIENVPAGTGSNTDGSSDTAPGTTDGSGAPGEGDDGREESDNGDYSADENGGVNESGNDGNNPDEAAFASSYINRSRIATEAGRLAANGLSITKIGWGLGKEKDGDGRPLDAVSAEEKYSSLGARFLPEKGKICLTFDEGYENGHTSEILDVLKEKKVSAVFFVTYDYCRTSPELVKRMIAEGHVVGNHTYSHPSMPNCSDGEMTEEVTMLHDYVKEQFGYEMTLFRFPKGEFSENALDVVHKLGYTSVFWSFAYSDWDTSAQPDPGEALEKIKNSAHSGIYLLHAVSETNAKILGDVIDFWQGEGYSVGSEL